MFDREHVKRKISECREEARKHYLLAVASWTMFMLLLSVAAYHADWVFMLLNQNKVLVTFIVPTVMLLIHVLGILLMNKVTHQSIFRGNKNEN